MATCLVIIGSELVGEVVALASGVTSAGAMVRWPPLAPLPRGSIVTVHFRSDVGGAGEIVARAEVMRDLVGALDLRFLDWS